MSRKPWSPTHLLTWPGNRMAAASLLSGCLLLTLGCFHTEKSRGQAEEEKERFQDIDTIGSLTTVGNVEPLPVQGIGLVTELDGTGGGTPPGELRKTMENELRRQKHPNPKQMLDSPSNALVVVTGFLPPGSRRGDLFDVQITLPPGSKVNSLRGGYLQECYLRMFDTKSHVNPNHHGPDKVLSGHQLAKASGHLIVGLNPDGEQEGNLLGGVIWEGGLTFLDRPYHFYLQDKRKSAKFADAVAQRLNNQFQDDPKKRLEVLQLKNLLILDEVTNQINAKFNQGVMNNRDTARAVNQGMVVLNVPWEYRHNTQRYIQVARHIPLLEAKDKRQPYREQLKVLLHDPAQSLRAAVRLEALGKESAPMLKTGLKDNHPLVRFASAEALAYLGDSSGVPELAKLAEEQFLLRAYCLTAMASVEQTISRTKLTELLAFNNAETRYGAFRALQLLNVSNPGINGVVLNNSFRLHRLAPDSPGLVHFTLNRRAEVVLFGQTAFLIPPFKIRAGKEFNVTAVSDDQVCTIGRFQLRNAQVSYNRCSLRLEDVLATLAGMGAEYPEVVELLRQVEDQKCLNCPISLNALPQAMPMEDLARTGSDAAQWGVAPAQPGNGRLPVAPVHYQTAISDH